jgi:hypothetical protein
LPENRFSPRIKSGAGFLRIVLERKPGAALLVKIEPGGAGIVSSPKTCGIDPACTARHDSFAHEEKFGTEQICPRKMCRVFTLG